MSNVTGLDRVRRRSVGFLEREGSTWACFLVTYRDKELRWHGYFSFRPRDGDFGHDEIRTADIFIEASEEAIDRKARGLGLPLLGGLLSSAIHTAGQSDEASPRLRHWFREMLSQNSREIAESWEGSGGGGFRFDASGGENREGKDPGRTNSGEPELARMRSLYESYRLDQVAHFISLVRPDDFRAMVDRVLDGRPFDFGAKDRLQFAMIVVEFIESRLPLPPFEVWAEDYLSNTPAYQLYAHTLHREGRLP